MTEKEIKKLGKSSADLAWLATRMYNDLISSIHVAIEDRSLIPMVSRDELVAYLAKSFIANDWLQYIFHINDEELYAEKQKQEKMIKR